MQSFTKLFPLTDTRSTVKITYYMHPARGNNTETGHEKMVLDKVMVVYVRDPIEHARQACSVKNSFLLQTPSERPCRKSSSDTAYELR